ncbi:hypothetical protein [Micromonospora globbae]|uniref:hypothetical protein n=1 Tax=Micromonospora globbae TaxID=1894969 RepID=UPI003435DC6F
MLGRDLSFGSLDNAAVLTTLNLEEFTPTGQYIVAVEVKNIRSWIYRSTAELYQLLYKAAQLQLDHPTHRFVPVFVCRRAQYMTNQMAEALGFYVISTKRQYVPASVAGRELDEVNTELGYDLEPAPASPPPALVKHFTATLQSVAERTASRWSVTAQALVENFKALRNDRLSNRDREELTHELLDIAADIHDNHRGTITNYGDLGTHQGVTTASVLEDDVPF